MKERKKELFLNKHIGTDHPSQEFLEGQKTAYGSISLSRDGVDWKQDGSEGS